MGSRPTSQLGCHRVVSSCHFSSHGKIGKIGLSSQFQGEE